MDLPAISLRDFGALLLDLNLTADASQIRIQGQGALCLLTPGLNLNIGAHWYSYPLYVWTLKLLLCLNILPVTESLNLSY